MADRNRRQERARQQRAPETPVIHEAPPFKPPRSIARFASPLVFIPAGIVAGLILVAIAFALRDDDDTPVVAGPVGTPSATATVEGTPTEAASPTPNPRSFEQAEDVTDPEAFDYRATIETDKGTFEIDLLEDVAPNTVNSFVFLAEEGFYDGLTWHLVQENFIAESGDPRTAEEEVDEEGEDGPGYQTTHEPNDLLNLRGRISMVKEQGATTFGSKFFINLKDNPARDAATAGQGATAYYPFAEVIGDGMDVVDQIEQDDVIESITIQELPQEEDEG